MAELLVYNRDHWMDDNDAYTNAHLRIEQDDSLTPAQIIKSKENLTNKYNARYQRGDVVEVRPDGFWTDGTRKGFGEHAFALVVIPGLSLKDAEKYTESHESIEDLGLETEKRTILKRRKYQIDMEQVVLAVDKKATISQLDDISIADKSVIVRD